MDLEETRLPGIGLRHDFVTAQGRRVGVVSQRSGARELVIYDPLDPDACQAVITLTGQEGEVLAELLGAPRVVERLARLREQIEGISTEGLLVAEDSPFAGRSLGDAAIRTRTGASVVAVFRGGELIASPRPDFVFQAGDRVVVVGTEDGVHAVAGLLADG
ncbi:cation:proton antiporter regulatory subunit [Nocardioides panaciterrulae]|jgi:TrkA domain protein|uniref:TrkA domain protein n=1 Tax=Nocardioides panaciterrulae TaxID=661492 RepID=A0A7Y9E9Q6_9ACTN|nr:cation:proton antiporter regulatory subunit [Nocardioides panaciterrulae]NYD43587.1 TrkA domain protein [Nocardioides panaciterrulae]